MSYSMIVSTILLAPTTDAFIIEPFGLFEDGAAGQSLTFMGSGFSGVESAVLEYKDPAQNAWYPVKTNNTTYQLDIDSNVRDIYMSWAEYRLNKSVTVNPVGLSINIFDWKV